MSDAAVTRGDVAKGAGLAGLARLSIAIEAFAQPIYVGLFGLATYGGRVNTVAPVRTPLAFT